MTRRRPINNRQEPEFGYARRSEPYFDEPRGDPSRRAVRSRPRRSLLPIFLVGAVIILFGGFLWISYVKGPKFGAGQLPLIMADSGPVKVKPDKPGGAEIPFQDTTVYDDLNQGKQKHLQPEVEHLLQPPEQPLPMPAPAADIPAPQPPPVAVATVETEVAPATATTQTGALKEDVAPAVTSKNEAVLAPEPAPAPMPEPAAKLPAPPPELALPVPVVKPAPKPTVDVTTVKPKPSPTAGLKNSVVQLGSFKDQDAAKGEWQRLKTRYSDQLTSLSPIYQRVDLGEKGIWYRLRAGSLTTDKAKSICVALSNAKAPCIVSTR